MKLQQKPQKEMLYVLMNKPLEQLKPYFVNSDLTKNEEYSDIQFNINHAFEVATRSNNVILIQYLLTSPELLMHADINFDDNIGMYNACCDGNQNLVQYLNASPELKQHAPIPTNEEELEDIFGSVCNNMIKIEQEINEYNLIDEEAKYSELEDYETFLHFLVFDCKVVPTNHIVSILKINTNKDFHEPAIEQLYANKIHKNVQSLKEQLGKKSKKDIKMKI
jgi:hypothetical protein